MKINRAKYEELLPQLGKRARIALQKILENGSVSTYEIGQLGYNHPPRVIRDLREAGIHILTKMGTHPETGSRMAIYVLGAPEPEATKRITGRKAIPKRFRQEVLSHHHSKCNICNSQYDDIILQIDHRVPYEIGGEVEAFRLSDFQPLCGSHQRLKSWVCEHCPNWQIRSIDKCKTCYWAIPNQDYEHVATTLEKRADLTWRGEEIQDYERLRQFAEENSINIPDALKLIVKQLN